MHECTRYYIAFQLLYTGAYYVFAQLGELVT